MVWNLSSILLQDKSETVLSFCKPSINDHIEFQPAFVKKIGHPLLSGFVRMFIISTIVRIRWYPSDYLCLSFHHAYNPDSI